MQIFKKMHNVIGLVVLFVLGLWVAPVVWASVFPDVADTHRNYTAIEYLKENEVITGYPDGTFKPDQAVNRAEMLKILIEGRKLLISANKNRACFPDVNDEWFAKYVCYAKTLGWIKGYSDGTFKPGQTVNKVEAVKMLVEVNQMADELLETVESPPYIDAAANEWYAGYLVLAKQKGLLEELGTEFGPGEGMTRAGMSEMMYRVMKIKEDGLERFPAGEYAEVLVEEEIPCMSEGEEFSDGIGKVCCEGLTSICADEIDLRTGNCPAKLCQDVNLVCSACGDSVCEGYENKCNCPSDCADDMSVEWETHQSDQMGVSFQYPSTANLVKEDAEKVLFERPDLVSSGYLWQIEKSSQVFADEFGVVGYDIEAEKMMEENTAIKNRSANRSYFADAIYHMGDKDYNLGGLITVVVQNGGSYYRFTLVSSENNANLFLTVFDKFLQSVDFSG